jgi:hypothetical protein
MMSSSGLRLGWHAEAVSLREDLVRAARGALPGEWERFRLALPDDDRLGLHRRAEDADSDRNIRRLLTTPFRSRDESYAPAQP